MLATTPTFYSCPLNRPLVPISLFPGVKSPPRSLLRRPRHIRREILPPAREIIRLRRVPNTSALQPAAAGAVIPQLGAALALARVAEAGVHVGAGGAGDCVLGGGGGAGFGLGGGGRVEGLAGDFGEVVGLEGGGGGRAAGGEGLGVEFGGVVGFGDELADLVLFWWKEGGVEGIGRGL